MKKGFRPVSDNLQVSIPNSVCHPAAEFEPVSGDTTAGRVDSPPGGVGLAAPEQPISKAPMQIKSENCIRRIAISLTNANMHLNN